MKRGTAIAGTAALLLASASLHAAALVPGSVLIPAAAEPDPVGGIVVATLASGFSVAGAFSGTLYTDVIAGDASNPLGGLTFVYRVENDGVSGSHSIGRLTTANWLGVLTDASHSPFAGVAPASIDRNPTGDVIGFNFIPTPLDPLTGYLVPGTSSAKLVIQTQAANYAAAAAYLIDGGVAAAATLGPALATVPEGSVWALDLLLAGGVFAGLLIARRRTESRPV